MSDYPEFTLDPNEDMDDIQLWLDGTGPYAADAPGDQVAPRGLEQ